MRIKSYFASSVEQAIQEARQELGAEAMLITSRRSSPETRHLGTYEVIFGIDPRTSRAEIPSADLRSELWSLRAELQDIKSVLQLSGASPRAALTEGEALSDELIAEGLERKVARQAVAEALAAREQGRAQSGPGSLRELVIAALLRRLRFAPEFRSPDAASSKIAVFVGPAGAGKTTTLIKVAIKECLANRLSVRIISVDPCRVAAHERLRSLAGLIGLGFTAANTVQQLQEAIEESRGKNVILIDTPGYSAAEIDSAQDVLACLRRIEQKETHLVLPASMKRGDLMRAVRQFDGFQPDYLLFTKLDETESYGPVVSAALESNTPLSFFAGGQSIPEDLDTANGQLLVASLFRPQKAETVSAA